LILRVSHVRGRSLHDEKHALKLRRYLENVFFPAIGSRSVTSLLPVDILEAVRSAQERGRIQTAHRLTQLAGLMCQPLVLMKMWCVTISSIRKKKTSG